MHRASTTEISIPELAPRLVFRDMALAATGPAPTMHPNAVLVRTMLAAFMHQLDYAAAIVVLRTFGTYGASWSLTTGMFGAVINALIRRLWMDNLFQREAGWDTRFLGTALTMAHQSDKTIRYMADQASRKSFAITDPLGALTRLDVIMLSPKEQSSVVRRKSLEATWGPVAYKLPESVPRSKDESRPSHSSDNAYSIIPLERLLLRAIFADIMPPEGDQTLAVQNVWDIVSRAEEEMLPPPTIEQAIVSILLEDVCRPRHV